MPACGGRTLAHSIYYAIACLTRVKKWHHHCRKQHTTACDFMRRYGLHAGNWTRNYTCCMLGTRSVGRIVLHVGKSIMASATWWPV